MDILALLKHGTCFVGRMCRCLCAHRRSALPALAVDDVFILCTNEGSCCQSNSWWNSAG